MTSQQIRLYRAMMNELSIAGPGERIYRRVERTVPHHSKSL